MLIFKTNGHRIEIDGRVNVEHPLFEAMEGEFENWIEDRPDFEAMYYGEEAIFEKEGAIYAAIDELVQFLEDEKRNSFTIRDIHLFDCAASFE